jgi:hypothetical protein
MGPSALGDRATGPSSIRTCEEPAVRRFRGRGIGQCGRGSRLQADPHPKCSGLRNLSGAGHDSGGVPPRGLSGIGARPDGAKARCRLDSSFRDLLSSISLNNGSRRSLTSRVWNHEQEEVLDESVRRRTLGILTAQAFVSPRLRRPPLLGLDFLQLHRDQLRDPRDQESGGRFEESARDTKP